MGRQGDANAVGLNGARLAYDLAGSGPAVVLIGGGGTLDRRAWDGQVAALARRHTVLRYDIRGIGGSSRPDAPFSHSEDLHGLLKALQLAPAVIVGLSLGGAIAIDHAGHLLNLDAPAAFNAILEDFVESVSRTPGSK